MQSAKIVILLAAIVLLLPFVSTDVNAQGEYLEKGTSGFGISGSFTSSGDVSGIGLSAGYSINGIFDLGLSVTRVSLDEDELGFEIKGTMFSPSMGVLLVKQTKEMPISVVLSGGYVRTTYSGDFLDQENIEMRESGFFFGTSLYGVIPVSSQIEVMPSLGVCYTSIEGEIEDNVSGDTWSGDVETTSFQVGLSMRFMLPEGRTFFVRPGVSIDEDDTASGISIGFVFPVVQKKRRLFGGP